MTERPEADDTAAAASAADGLAARGVIGAHALQHAYANGFYVLLPEIYVTLGLTPVSAGALEAVRRASGGIATMAGGFLLDRYAHRRIPVLFASLIAMGVGYLLVGLSPSFAVILIALAAASTAGSIWHPAAIGLLSRAFPARRGFVVSVHRSSGSVGDVIGPLLAGGLLLVVGWRAVLYGALPIALAVAAALIVLLGRAPKWRAFRTPDAAPRPAREQARALSGLLRSRPLLLLLLLAGTSGMGQGGLLMWTGLYLRETQQMGSVGIGIHVAMLTGIGIVTGPLLGRLSDRIGRKPVIVRVLAAKAVIATLLALFGSGWRFTLGLALLGAVLFATNSLVQAAALDLADGSGLEGSMIGILWGSNAVFVGGAPLIVGAMIASLGYGVLFWWVAVLSAIAMLVALAMPDVRRPAVVEVG
jgi:FSR family fosmidomycin resistance protein-like MFS transporter